MPEVITFDEAISATDGKDRSLLIGNGFSIKHFSYDTLLAASGIAFVVAFWVGLFMTRRIVRSARDGAPFEARNVSRLRLLAAMFAAIPVGAEVSRRLLQSTVDADPRVTISIQSPDWGIYLLVALVLLALAEIFREGTALRELDEQTV